MIRVQTEDFDTGHEIALVRSVGTAIGAIVAFVGVVRDWASNGQITSLTLEHYPGMTEKELARIEKEAYARWPLLGSTIIHRIGHLEPGDNIVLVITASAHRQAAFDAAQFLMDYLKTEAPFWKSETRGGEKTWVDARSSDRDALVRWQPSDLPSGKPAAHDRARDNEHQQSEWAEHERQKKAW
jgi:molybdopterin synthase catalytic subunit